MLLNPKQPLWMPQGSVRSILALVILVPVAVISLKSGVNFTGDQVIGLASLVLLAYFNRPAADAKPSETTPEEDDE